MNQQLSTMRAGASMLLPIYPQSFEECVRFARLAAIGGMIKPIKKGYGEKEEVESNDALEARATMIIMQGMELGLPPMQSIQLLAMINGRICAHSEAVPGLLLSKGIKITQRFSGTRMADDWTAHCRLERPDGQVFESEFSVLDAKQAKLWSPEAKLTKRGRNNDTYQVDNDAAWHRFPKRMLWARALGFAAKDGAADVMRGLAVREEVEDLVRAQNAIDITPEAPRQVAAAPSVKTLDIPDDDEITPKAAPVPEQAAPAQDASQDENEDPLADPDSFLEKLKDDLALCDSVEEVNEVADANAGMIARCPKEQRLKAAQMIAAAIEGE